MATNRKWSEEQRAGVVELRKAGISWAKISKQTGIPKGTCIGIWKEAPKDDEFLIAAPQTIMARVLKLVPNPRLMLIYFDDREGVARCVKRPESNHPPKSQVLVKKVDDDLYRIA
tara:strand:+ start:173 stop:517 length:345 start_codon:yes stop_codon:yes gene_type:complete